MKESANTGPKDLNAKFWCVPSLRSFWRKTKTKSGKQNYMIQKRVLAASLPRTAS